MDLIATYITVLWLALTGMCWVQQAVKYFTAGTNRIKKQVTGTKLLLSMAACLPVSSACVFACRMIDFALNDTSFELTFRITMIAGAVFMVVFAGWSLIRLLKAKL